MTRFVTLNQFVNIWECDENDHMNVQFYYAKFDDAGQIFAVCNGLETALGKRIGRHVRYHSELRGGAQIRILSSLVGGGDSNIGPQSGCYVQHVMQDCDSGRLAATALDWHEGAARTAYARIIDLLDMKAAPRALKAPADRGIRQAPAKPEAAVSRGILHPALCDAQGIARDQAYIGAVSDAASHAWDRIGVSTEWLNTHGFGRVAVEMRLCVHSPMRLGELYQLQLAFTGVQSRAFTKRYDFFDLRDGRHIAFLETAAMILNHTTRRSEPLPDFARDVIAQQLG